MPFMFNPFSGTFDFYMTGGGVVVPDGPWDFMDGTDLEFMDGTAADYMST